MASPWKCGSPLSDEASSVLRRRAIFDCCKWHGTLCNFPLILRQSHWKTISRLAVSMARELAEAEMELVARHDLHEHLGLPAELRIVLRELTRAKPTPGGVRVVRFDFHWTTEGWKISEANADAASGFIESSSVTRLMQAHFPEYQTCGDPAGALAECIVEQIGPRATVGLMHLSVYSEDRQVMLYLARRFVERGLHPQLFHPLQLRWTDEAAYIDTKWFQGPLDFVFRFLPAEWVVQMPRETGWMRTAHSGATEVCNPLTAVLTQSKRFPLVWKQLDCPLNALSALLPETLAPEAIDWRRSKEWIVKPSLGHEGIRVGMPDVTSASDWDDINDGLRLAPDQWIVQRRFDTIPLLTPRGWSYPCLGVYVIGGAVVGAYGRLSRSPLVNDQAWDIAVLLDDDCVDGSSGDN